MDFSNVIKVRLYMEGGEQIDISVNDLGDFLIQDIRKDVLINQQHKIVSEEIAKSVAMEIHKRANKENTFDAICSLNICAVGLGGKDELKIVSLPFYKFKNKNKYQDTYKSNLGHLYVTVDKHQKVLDIFDSNIISSMDREDIFPSQLE